MDALSRLFAVLTVSFTVGGVTSLTADGSTDMGLTQINDRSWCLPTRWYPAGYLQTLGKINYCKDLFDPYLNLVAAKALYDYAEKTNGNGFTPWGK